MEIEFDRKEEREHPLLGIEFGGSFVVKTRATLSYEVEPPLFPALTLSLFDPVPPACPPLIVGSRVPFPMLAPCVPACQPASQPACLLAFLPACVRACVRACVHVAFHCLRNASSTGFAFASLFLRQLLSSFLSPLRFQGGERAGSSNGVGKVTASNELILARGSLERFHVP